ncbi:3-ketoacyl-ACP reductase [Photobacterium sp. TY1-4]|nr:3-ketoacyl-ACP reductase [Photobacterium sp. TY1-4]UXI04026.1 3-ketoacyl-ACP reductase [Photobacterium sp. TY1-4]
MDNLFNFLNKLVAYLAMLMFVIGGGLVLYAMVYGN